MSLSPSRQVLCLALSLPMAFAARAAVAQKNGDLSADRTLRAVAELHAAAVAWRQEIEAGKQVHEQEVARLRAAIQRLGPDLQAILFRHEASLKADGGQTLNSSTARERSQEWIERLRSIGDGATERRAKTVEELRAALAGDDATQRLAALLALSATGDVDFDKRPFRELIVPLTESDDGETTVAAFYALFNTSREPGDLDRVRDAWKRRSQRLDESMSHLLFSFGDGRIDGPSAEIVLELLASPDARTRREALRGLWGAQVSEDVAARIIELVDDPESHHDAIYFGLSTLKDKDEAVIDALVATLSDPDWNNWQRALWGLGHGVPEQHQLKVARVLVELHNARTDPRVRNEAAKIVRKYGGDELAAELN